MNINKLLTFRAFFVLKPFYTRIIAGIKQDGGDYLVGAVMPLILSCICENKTPFGSS